MSYNNYEEDALKYKQLIQSIRDYAIFKLDKDGIISSWNPGAERIKLYEPNEIIGKHFSIFYTPEDLLLNKPEWELEQAIQLGRFEDEGWRVRKDGSHFWANVIITPIIDEKQIVIGFSKITRDMTQRKIEIDELKKAYEELDMKVQNRTSELQETKDRLELTLSAAEIGSWELDLISENLICSDTFNRMFGFHKIYPTSRTDYYDRMYPEDRLQVQAATTLSINNHHNLNVEYRVVWEDGSIHWISARGKTIYDKKNNPIRLIGTAINIDEHKKSKEHLEEMVRLRTDELVSAQSALVHSAKMSALGEMAGGIAHEFNTPLTSITMKAQQIQRRSKDHSGLEQFEKDGLFIYDTAKRIANIINGLRTFARDGLNDSFTLVSANQIVESVLVFCQSRFNNCNVKVIFNRSKNDIKVLCRQIQMEQVLLNLLNNSFDSVLEIEERWIEISILEDNNSVIFRVIDSGSAISKEFAQKIIQPFFTTKPVGKGTGLGLSISKGIIDQHKGNLIIDSDNHHACFRIELPREIHDVK